MVSKPDTGRCASEKAKAQRGGEHEGSVLARALGGVNCEIPHRLGRRTLGGG